MSKKQVNYEQIMGKTLKSADGFHQPILFLLCELAFGNSTNRALACASTAVNTLVGIDLELSISHADSTNRALCFTCTTANTAITNYICHNYILLTMFKCN